MEIETEGGGQQREERLPLSIRQELEYGLSFPPVFSQDRARARSFCGTLFSYISNGAAPLSNFIRKFRRS